uniref:Uncharacterized protein n=1 Tax=Romanomermis culicivorax TaxID=13658 RepID=A0A915IM02_ROMCU
MHLDVELTANNCYEWPAEAAAAWVANIDSKEVLGEVRHNLKYGHYISSYFFAIDIDNINYLIQSRFYRNKEFLGERLVMNVL